MLSFENDLAAVLQALNTNEIVPALLKGSHLAAIIYSEPSHRPMSDFDLLVSLDQMETAVGALKTIGYASEHARPVAVWSDRSRDLRMHKPGCFTVELHWGIADPRDPVFIDLGGLWQRTREVRVFGKTARVLSSEDLLLHVCFHASVSHQFDEKGLRPFFDVQAITDRLGESLDWNLVAARAREWGIERATFLMLELASQHGVESIPAHVLARLRPKVVPNEVVEAARALMFEVPPLRSPVAPRSIAYAWTSPRSMWRHLFSPQNRTQPTVAAQSQAYAAQYVTFIWDCLLRDRQRLTALLRRIRRHLVLSGWLTKEKGGAEL
jgi:putative nucleotidyltransferase-like protein